MYTCLTTQSSPFPQASLLRNALGEYSTEWETRLSGAKCHSRF